MHQESQRFESGRIGGVGRQFEQAVDQNGTEQLRSAAGGIEDLAGISLLIRRQLLGSRLGPVNAVDGFSQIANYMSLAGQELMPALTALAVAPGPFIGSPLRRSLPSCLLGGPLSCHGGEARQLAAPGTVWASGAVGFVEINGQIEGPVSLGTGGWGVLAAHFEQAHRKAEHRSGQAVAAHSLNAGVTTVPTRQFDSLDVRVAEGDGLVPLLHAHPPSTPDLCDMDVLAEAIDEYLHQLELDRHRSPRTVSENGRDVQRFLRFAEGAVVARRQASCAPASGA